MFLICYTDIFLDGEDYTRINETITFQAEELKKTVLIFIVDDSRLEDRENFEVTFTALPGLFPVTVLNDTVTIAIVDDDSKLFIVCALGRGDRKFSISKSHTCLLKKKGCFWTRKKKLQQIFLQHTRECINYLSKRKHK